jgi:hypothetical protein
MGQDVRIQDPVTFTILSSCKRSLRQGHNHLGELLYPRQSQSPLAHWRLQLSVPTVGGCGYSREVISFQTSIQRLSYGARTKLLLLPFLKIVWQTPTLWFTKGCGDRYLWYKTPSSFCNHIARVAFHSRFSPCIICCFPCIS